MLSVSAFVVPVLLDTNPDASHIARQWARFYHYGHIYKPALCVGTTALYACASSLIRYATAAEARSPEEALASRYYAAAAASTIAMVPFTWLVMAPTNNVLFRLAAAAAEGEKLVSGRVRSLVVRWAWLHAARSLFPLLGAILGLATLRMELLSVRPPGMTGDRSR